MDRERIGKYRIDGERGSGTMGVVYEAYDPVLERSVALKTLAVRVIPDDETRDRFLREARAAAPLHHPNIVTVHDFGEEDGLLYMAMEFLEGNDLRDAIDTDLLKTLDKKLDVMDGVLAGLDYAHARGVVHRDIKPANIHLGPDREVKIMDFGLARVSTSEMTQEGIVLGTPNYMSPEQALGDKVDGRSDLFSAGAVLYEMLTGHKPFEADSTPSVLFQVVHRQPPPVRRWAPDAPAAIVAVVNRALEKDRSKRFVSAAEMRSALAAARQAPAASPAPKAPPLPRAARPVPPPLPAFATPPLPDGFAASGRLLPPRPRIPTPKPMPSPDALRASMPEPPAGWVSAASPAGRLYRRPLLAGVALAVVIAAVAFVAEWRRGRPVPTPSPGSTAASATIDTLTQELVRKQVQLARRELEDKNYAAARSEAEGALKLAPGHAEAAAVLADARGRTLELERAIGEARRLVEAGDTGGASRELSRALELDPRHPAAADLSAHLNSVFRAQADQAAASMRAGRTAALAVGIPAEALRAADEGARRAEALMSGGNFADATRLFLETRDALDRSRRDALVRQATTTLAPGRAATEPNPRSTPTAAATPTRPLPGRAEEAAPPETAARPAVARGFVAEGTSVATPSAGGIEGFDSSDVSSRRPPQFSGQMEFEVLPPTVRPGEPFVVRIHLRNDGRRAVKVRGLSLAAVVDGRRVPAPAKALQREVPAQSRALVAEYSGVWSEAGSWTLEAVLTADRNETVSSRLRAN